MTNVLTFNRGLSAVVSKEILTEITEIRNGLPRTAPWEASIGAKISKLARIAKTSQLRGVHRALTACAAGSDKLTTGNSEEIATQTTNLLQALLTHLQETVTEHKNAPMKMARAVQQLNQALGHAASPMLAAEMFLPFTPEDVSPVRPTENTLDVFIAAVTQHRTAYQASLVKLIKGGDLSQLASMRQTLVTLEPKNPHPGYRVFFEAAIAAFDCLMKSAQLDNAGKWIVSKIDPELSLIAQGSNHVSDDLLSTIMYVVAKAEPDTGARVRKLQDQYSLKNYIAELTVVDPAIIDKFLSVLVKARELWSTKQDLPYMLKITGDLVSKAAYLHNPGFTTTVTALHEVFNTIHSQQLQVSEEELSLEGASALIVLEQQLREGPNVELAQMSASRIYRLIGKDVDAGAGDKQTGASIMHQVASEVQEDLLQLEPRLLEMLNDQHDGEDDFRQGLKKIVKILRIFGKDNPLSKAVAKFEETLKIETSMESKTTVAAQYTQLSSLVEHLKTSEKAAMTAAQKWLDSMAPADDSVADVGEDVDMPNDKEMLEIFLEEAAGIILDLNKWLKSLKSDPSEHDTLVNVRRGYHTLKGSGRMVGLSRFGDMSYISELLLNSWISSKKFASPELLQFLEDATDRAASSINDFQTTGSSVVVFDDLEDRALELGGTPLSDAPQSKKSKGSSSAKPAAKPAAKKVDPAPEVKAPEPLPVEVDPAPMELAPIAETSIPVEDEPAELESSIISVLAFEEPATEVSAPSSLAFETPEEAPAPVEEPLVVAIASPQEDVAAEPHLEPSAMLSFEDTINPQQESDISQAPTITFDEEPASDTALAFEHKQELSFDMDVQSSEPELLAEDLQFEIPGEDIAPAPLVPELPPLEELAIEAAPPVAPVLNAVEPKPAVVKPKVEVPKEEPVLEPVKETPKPSAAKAQVESAPRKKTRETPSAWQKGGDTQNSAKARSAPTAPAKTGATKTVPKKSPSKSSKPVQKKGLLASFIDKIKGLFGGKK